MGSNLDHPERQLSEALQALAALPATRLLQQSHFYASKPQGPQDQPDFMNAVCLLETDLSAHALLQALQQIEQSQGRVKKRHWGERCIDLDILLYGDQSIQTPELTVPHKEMATRDFVLLPLAEISPGRVIPGMGRVETLIAQLEQTFVVPWVASNSNHTA
nr:2-amino-4-hydroxy-6-hydroxymethyldihydropteridine diphosphokinase [Thiomicrorhabdus cannonii]